MKVRWNSRTGKLSFGNTNITAICDVRNELNGRRELTEKPVHAENADGSEGRAYMPRWFPLGTWKIVAIIPKADPYEAPEFISTDAHQLVDEWTEVGGRYGEKTGRQVEDYGYGLHNSTSLTTLGCGHILQPADRAAFVAAIQTAWANGEDVSITVSDEAVS